MNFEPLNYFFLLGWVVSEKKEREKSLGVPKLRWMGMFFGPDK